MTERLKYLDDEVVSSALSVDAIEDFPSPASLWQWAFIPRWFLETSVPNCGPCLRGHLQRTVPLICLVQALLKTPRPSADRPFAKSQRRPFLIRQFRWSRPLKK